MNFVLHTNEYLQHTPNNKMQNLISGQSHTSEIDPQISVRNLNFFYGNHQALINNTIDIARNKVTAIIGPSGCGKSTHIRVYNRIFELYKDQRATGEVLIDGKNILESSVDPIELRRKVGMIFQRFG